MVWLKLCCCLHGLTLPFPKQTHTLAHPHKQACVQHYAKAESGGGGGMLSGIASMLGSLMGSAASETHVTFVKHKEVLGDGRIKLDLVLCTGERCAMLKFVVDGGDVTEGWAALAQASNVEAAADVVMEGLATATASPAQHADQASPTLG